jgi:hypothetical protein
MKYVGLQHLAPNLESSSFEDWWEGVVAAPADPAYKGLHKGLNSLIILGAWAIWNHRNVVYLMVCSLVPARSSIGSRRSLSSGVGLEPVIYLASLCSSEPVGNLY